MSARRIVLGLLVSIGALSVLASFALPDEPAKTPKLDLHGDALPLHAVTRIGSTRFRHAGTVTCILFAADGKTVFTGSEDKTISQWNAEAGQELVRHVGGHEHEIVALALSADGRTLYSADAECAISEWLTTKALDDAVRPIIKEAAVTTRTIGGTLMAALAPNGTLAAIAGPDGHILIRQPRKSDNLSEIKQEGSIRAMAFSPGATRLAVNADYGGVTLYEVKTGEMLQSFGKGALSCMAFDPDGSFLATANYENTITVWDLKGKAEGTTLEGHKQAPVGKKNGVFCLAFSPDGKWLASGGGDATVRLWDVAKRKQVAVLEGHTERVTAVAFSPDSKRLLSGGADHLLRLWDMETHKEICAPTEPAGALTSLAISSDGQLLATIHSPNKLLLWDLTTGKKSEHFPTPRSTASAVAFLPDGKTLLTGDNDKDLFQSWDLKSGKGVPWKTKAPRGIGPTLGLDAEGTRMASANPSGKVLTVWDPIKGELLLELENIGGGNVVALAVSPDGKTVAGAGSSSSIRLWKLPSGKPLLDMDGHLGGTYAIAFSEDGRTLASCGKDRMIRLWEVASGKERRSMGGQKSWVRALAFDATGRFLATGNMDGAVRIWDAQNGKLLHELTGHRGAVTGVAFAPKGAKLVSISVDATALAWDAALLRADKPPPIHLKQQEIENCWKDLAWADAPTAAVAMQTLARAPEQTVPLVRERLVPLTDAKLADWIRELDSDKFEVRREAKRKLAEAGRAAEAALQNALKNDPSPEVAARVKELLDAFADKGIGPEELRMLRSVEILEMIDTKEARNVLMNLTEGTRESELTLQAKAALERMRKRADEKR